MAMQTVTLRLPDQLYERLRRQAQDSHRTIEEELLDMVVSNVAGEPQLPGDLASAIEHLPFLETEALWRAAKTALSPRDASRLERLHLKRQREALTAAEEHELARLMQEYERALLARARATQLLAERGEDVSALAPAP
jgi:plasmid stability protein